MSAELHTVVSLHNIIFNLLTVALQMLMPL